MSPDQSLIDKWALEYEKGGIPSSVRASPSGAMVWAVELLKRQGFPLREGLDVGCGKGRNSLYMARQGMHVTAMDFTPDAIEHLEHAAAAEKLGDKIRPLVQDVTEPWPVAPVKMDLVVDLFCFKHITPHEARLEYKRNLLRTLRTRGHYLISFASIGDGYYGQYAAQGRPDGEEATLIADPVNGIPSVLFTRKHILNFFLPELDLFAEIQQNAPSEMHGKTYERSAYALLLRWSPQHFH
ncbi:MAG: class I SAM-dependent methyltransferase [Alphaproteobacteria bacterium]|nr:class I SAM-dependent methyltransferase [Alphaproteobacteria bacterium]